MADLWNPHWLCYSAAHGYHPASMLDVDAETWPGGKMAGFIVWMNRRWGDWAQLRGLRINPSGRDRAGRPDSFLGPADEADFIGWLRGTVFRLRETCVFGQPISSRVEHTDDCSHMTPPDCRCSCGADAVERAPYLLGES